VPTSQNLPIEKIYVPLDKRKKIDEQTVQQIAESILNDGQRVPIVVRSDGDRFVLIDGSHRLEACKALGETTILGVLSSAPVAAQKPAASYELSAEAERQKMQRLRQLRLEKEAAEARATVPYRQPTPQQPQNSRRRSNSRSGAEVARPKTLSEWIESREREGFKI
jgi:hypothetical protein